MNYYPLPTLWWSNNSHTRSRLLKRSAYFSPLWAVRSSHSLRTMEVWSRDVNCHYGNGNCSLMNTWTAVSPKSIIKKRYCLEHTFLWLGWHWKGAKKWNKLETVVLTSSGRGHTSCDFMHKWSYVWYTEMLTQQWLSTIKRVFLCTMFCWWHTRTGMYLHNGTMHSLSKGTTAIAKAWTFYWCKKVKKCKNAADGPFSHAQSHIWTSMYGIIIMVSWQQM